MLFAFFPLRIQSTKPIIKTYRGTESSLKSGQLNRWRALKISERTSINGVRTRKKCCNKEQFPLVFQENE